MKHFDSKNSWRARATPASRGLAALLTVLLTLSLPAARTLADVRGDARAHFQRGQELYRQGAYRDAISEFRAADQLAPSPLLDYNIGLAFERLGEAKSALSYFTSYLQREPNAPNRAAVEAKIRRLQAALEGERAALAAPAEPPMAPVEELPDGVPGDATTAGDVPPGDVVAADPELARVAADPELDAVAADPELARVAAIDIGKLRDERRPTLAGLKVANEQPINGQPVAPAADPVYKKWWFWVAVVVGTILFIDLNND